MNILELLRRLPVGFVEAGGVPWSFAANGYIPVRLTGTGAAAGSTNAAGYVSATEIATDGLIPWKDYIPVYVDDTKTVPFSFNANGYIPLVDTLTGGSLVTSTWDSTDKHSTVTVAGDDLIAYTDSDMGAVRGTFARAAGVYQFECTVDTDVASIMIGLADVGATISTYPGDDVVGRSWGYYSTDGNKYNAGSAAAYGASYTDGDVIGVVYNATAGTITFYKNGASQGTAFSSVAGYLFPCFGSGNAADGHRQVTINTGQTDFAYPIGGATAWGVEASESANPAVTWNPAAKDSDVTLLKGNNFAVTTAAVGAVRATVGYASGSHQYETHITYDVNNLVGLGNSSAALTNYPGSDANGWGWYAGDGSKYTGAASTAFAAAYTTADVVGCVWYADDGDIVFYKNGRFIGLAFTGVSGTLYPMYGSGTSGAGTRGALLRTDNLSYPIVGVADWRGDSQGAAVPAWNDADKDADVTVHAGDTVARVVSTGSQNGAIRAVTGRNSGVYQCEFITFGADDSQAVGLNPVGASLANYPGSAAGGYGYYPTAEKYTGGANSAYGVSWTRGDVIGVVYDVGAGTITFYKNGASQGTAFSSISATLHPSWGPGTSGSGTRGCYINTGQTPFVYPIGGATAWG